MRTVLVTGGSGFIGRGTARGFLEAGFRVRATCYRRPPAQSTEDIEWHNVGTIGSRTEWGEALAGVDAVIHTAGIAHATSRERGRELSAQYYEVNTRGTERLARCAAERRVRRLVFISSIHVTGVKTGCEPFSERTPADPQGDYARSKFYAEEALRKISAETGLETVIVRPPLVYGPRAPANFGQLVRLVRSRIPLPLGGINSKRSLISLRNLVDAFRLCSEKPAAANETFLASDDEDVTLRRLLELIAEGVDVKLRLIRVPPKLLRFAGRMTGRLEQIDKLCNSLQVDCQKIRECLGWQPPIRASEAIIKAAQSFR